MSERDPSATGVGERYGQSSFTQNLLDRRDLASFANRFLRWLSVQQPAIEDPELVQIRMPSGGSSSELFLIDIESKASEGTFPSSLVVRLEPQYHVYPIVDLGQQFRCADAANRMSDAPVPAHYWYESDRSHLGAPFVVCEARDGVAVDSVTDGWFFEASPEQRESLWWSSVEALADLHRLGIAEAKLEDAVLAVDGSTPLDRYLRYWRLYADFVSTGSEFPVIEEALSYLSSSRPLETLPEAFVWGDARLGNILYADGQPNALVDFEFAHVGLREFDVAFFSFMDRVIAEYFNEVPRLEGLPGHDETLDYYESVAGCRIRDRHYFTVMASAYNTLAVTRVLQGRAAQGFVPEEFVRTHGPMNALADLLGIARPAA